MIQKQYQLKGLDLITHDFFKDKESATIAKNVEKTDSGYLKSREGYQEHSSETGFIQFIDYYDRANSADRLIGVKSDGLYLWSGVAWINQPFAGTYSYTFTEPLSHTQINGVL